MSLSEVSAEIPGVQAVVDVVELVVKVKRPRAVRIHHQGEHRAPARRRRQRVAAHPVGHAVGDRYALREQRRQTRSSVGRQAEIVGGSSAPTVTGPISEPARALDVSSSALLRPPASLLPVDRSLPLRPVASGATVASMPSSCNRRRNRHLRSEPQCRPEPQS